MIRLRFWRHKDNDALDAELVSIFEQGSHSPTVDAARLDQGRTLVATRLRAEPMGGGWFGRRLAFGAAGGGGLWASMVGVAAANKAATAVGIGVLLAGGATAEISGIGPAVREAVSPAHSVGDSSPVATESVSATETAALEADNPQQNGNGHGDGDGDGDGAVVTDAPAGVPGNLSAHVRANGDFNLRGVLIAADGDLIEVLTSVDDVPLQFDLGDATVRIPGSNAPGGPKADQPEPTLEGSVGHLVTVAGTCDTSDGLLTEDCQISSVQVLGNAGQDGSSTEETSDAEQDDAGADRGRPDDAGRPDNPGKPPNTPGNGPGGNSGSD